MKRKIVKPLNDMVLFKQLNKDVSEGGILLPETVAQDYVFEVVSVGDKVKKIKKGQCIVFRTTDIIAVHNEGVDKDLYLVEEEKIIGIIEITQDSVIELAKV